MSDLDAMTPQDARDFYQRWYVPANAAVVVAGDVESAQVRALAKSTTAASPPARCRRASRAPSRRSAGMRRIEFKAPAEQAYVALAFQRAAAHVVRTGHADNDDALALTVLSAVLDGYGGARLDRALTQGRDRVADSAGAGNGLSGRGPQLFMLDGVPAARQDARAGRSRAARRGGESGAATA